MSRCRIKRTVPLSLTLLLLALLTSQQTDAGIPQNLVIIPGHVIARWNFSMSVNDLIRMNGSADRIRRFSPTESNDLAHGIIQFEWHRMRFVAVTKDRQKVVWLWVNMAMLPVLEYRTDKGIGSKDTPASVLRAYGIPTARTIPHHGETRLIYDALGIAFRFFQNGRLRTIGIFKPGTGRSIWKF